MEGKIVRFENWPILLSQFLAERKDTPFERGVNDCMIFCADAILKLTGIDVATELRGEYFDEEGALKIIEQYGETVEDIITAKLGKHKPISFAMRGDIVTYECDGNICGGVVDDTGRRAAFVLPNRGLTRIPLKLCRNAWGY